MTGEEFEAEVLSVARAMWPDAVDAGPVNRQGRERDGEFETAEITHLIECTTERALAKAKKDIEKMRKRILHLKKRNSSRLYKGWFITRHEPTADQRGVAEKCTEAVSAVSFREFRKKLVDADRYLSARNDYAFGSMRDPKTDSTKLGHRFVGLEYRSRDGERAEFGKLLDLVKDAHNVVILGDYGIGKSTTLCEMYGILKSEFTKQNHSRFPVVLNLRDHHAQTDPTEVLERHARKIGYPHAADLVRAWRAGYVDLLLDGFDEIATLGWAGGGRDLGTIRFRSMELIRRFVADSPRGIGIVLVGRAHYFDGEAELNNALGLRRNFRLFLISELSGDSVREFLSAIGWNRSVPDWIPTRPLLLGYLVARGILDQVVDEGPLSPAAGWNMLLDRISEREAQLEPGIEPRAVRRIIEEVAVLARGRNDGLGQLYPKEIVEAFVNVCTYEPDDRGAVLLQRLPGLGAHQTEDGARVFVDRDFANAAAGAALARFVQHPYNNSWESASWQYALLPIGLEVAQELGALLKLTAGHLEGAMNSCLPGTATSDVLVADLVMLAGINDWPVAKPVVVENVWIQNMPEEVFEGELSSVTFRNSIINVIEIPSTELICNLPVFENCHIGMVMGCPREQALDKNRFVRCEFDDFEEAAATTSAILELNLPLGVRVGLTVLKKIYRQSGAGRKSSALRRGLDQDAQKVLPKVLDVLQKYDFVMASKQGSTEIWLPLKSNNARARALAILDQPTVSGDSVLLPLSRL